VGSVPVVRAVALDRGFPVDDFVEQTDFRNELDFVVEFQKVHEEIRSIVELPDRLLRLFVRIAVANGGRISSAKRSKFYMLTEPEIAAMEEVVLRHLPKLSASTDLA
jgi:hypothetical protein